jgi:hypothetical protein
MAQIYIQLLLNEELSEDELDIAAVFIDEQLCGIGHIRLDRLSGKYLAAFPVYYKSPVGGVMEFRLWDASEGEESRYYSSENIFQSGSSIGSRINPLIIEPNETNQSISLESGWNWISFNVAPSDLSVERILENFPAESGDVIKGQSGFSEYTTDYGWIGSLDFLRPGEGYRFRSKNKKELTSNGRQADSWAMPASLLQGWNWIGYLPEKPLRLKDALYFMQAVPGDVIKSQTQSAIYNTNGEWLGTLREMHPGKSYLLHSQAKTDLVYPDLKKQMKYTAKPDWNVEPHLFESNMSVISAIGFEGIDYGDSTLIVATFLDGQCRGVTRPQYIPPLDRYVTFLMLYGDPAENGNSVELRVYDPANDVIRDIEEDLVFDSDAHIGNLKTPLELNAMPTESERIPAEFYIHQNYPNPFNPVTTIEYGLPLDEHVRLQIYNILGQKVAVLVDKQQKAGRYKVQLDAGSLNIASGVYFYQINTNAYVNSRKMLLLK